MQKMIKQLITLVMRKNVNRIIDFCKHISIGYPPCPLKLFIQLTINVPNNSKTDPKMWHMATARSVLKAVPTIPRASERSVRTNFVQSDEIV